MQILASRSSGSDLEEVPIIRDEPQLLHCWRGYVPRPDLIGVLGAQAVLLARLASSGRLSSDVGSHLELKPS